MTHISEISADLGRGSLSLLLHSSGPNILKVRLLTDASKVCTLTLNIGGAQIAHVDSICKSPTKTRNPLLLSLS